MQSIDKMVVERKWEDKKNGGTSRGRLVDFFFLDTTEKQKAKLLKMFFFANIF